MPAWWPLCHGIGGWMQRRAPGRTASPPAMTGSARRRRRRPTTRPPPSGLPPSRRAGTTDADAVVHALDGHTFSDMFARNGEFRASDHAVIHDLYIVKVKAPSQVTEPHAWFDVLATIPAATAFPDQHRLQDAIGSAAEARPMDDEVSHSRLLVPRQVGRGVDPTMHCQACAGDDARVTCGRRRLPMRST